MNPYENIDWTLNTDMEPTNHTLPPITFADVAGFYMGCKISVSSADGQFTSNGFLGWNHINLLNRTVPHLRPLNTATREECIAIAKLMGYRQSKATPAHVLATRGKNFCLSNGLIQLTSAQQIARLTAYLTRQHFDVFNLIENGFAIALDRTS